MHEQVECEGRVRVRGFCRGTFEVAVENLSSLQLNRSIESCAFEVGGFQWKIAICRCFRNGGRIEMIRIVVLSCNDVAVFADVNVTVSRRRKTENTFVSRKSKVACPFHILDRQFIHLDKLTDSDGESSCINTLVVTADLKNIRIATHQEHRTAGHDMRTIHLEIIDRESIINTLNKGSTFGVVPSEHRRHSDVCSYSFVRLWATQDPDFRYWLCERSSDGHVVVKRCLNNAGHLESFGKICDESTGVPWVTVLREQKKSNEEFQPINENTIIVFCMLYDPLCGDHSYLGHLLVQKQTSCQKLSAKIIEDMICIQEGEEYTLHLGEGGKYVKDLTYETSSLAKCGVHSGSVVIVKRHEVVKQLTSLNIQQPSGFGKDIQATDSGDILKSTQHGDDVSAVVNQVQHTDVQEVDFSNAKHSDHLTDSGIVGKEALEAQINKSGGCGVQDQIANVPLEEHVSPGPVVDGSETACPKPDVHESVKNSTSASIDHLTEEDFSLLVNQTHCQKNADQEMQDICKNKTSKTQDLTSEAHDCEEEKRISNEISTQCQWDLHTVTTDMCNSDMALVNLKTSDKDSSVEAVRKVTAAVKKLQKEFLTDMCNDLKGPIMKEIQKVGTAVNGVKTTISATHEEVCKANLMADTTFEQLTNKDTDLSLMDRDGQEAFMMADDFVKGEPIFLLNFKKDYRIRVRLVHKHQSDASNFRIKYVSVKPSDGQELGLRTVETKPVSEGSEVVALFQCDKFQSNRLSSLSPQFGSIGKKYISLPITIGVEAASPASEHTFELKGRVLCRMATGNDFLKLHSFRRFVLRSWRNCPQWMRDGARGAIMLSSMTAGNAVHGGQMMFISDLFSVISSLFVLPCFRLNGKQVPVEC